MPQSFIGVGIGPRLVGGVYRSGYWGQTYTVLAISFPGADDPWGSWYMTVRWQDGSETTHCTAWDVRLDRVVMQPEGNVHCNA